MDNRKLLTPELQAKIERRVRECLDIATKQWPQHEAKFQDAVMIRYDVKNRFGGLVTMADLPAALFVIDTRHEHTAVEEANQLRIPVVGLSSSDCDFSRVQYPIPGNDDAARALAHPEEKRSIGAVAAALIEEGDTIFVSSGTTATQVVASIPPGRRSLMAPMLMSL